MRWRGLAILIVLPFLASLALAEAPRVSLRPEPRPQVETTATLAPMLRPRPRADRLSRTAPVDDAEATPTPTPTRKGSVCNNRNIKGVAQTPIRSRTRGCGIRNPVLVTSVHGVGLDPAATINCAAAEALASWVDRGLQPAFRNQVVLVTVVDSYSCRPRNNVRGAKISEHGTGSAIDISGFTLRSGKTLTVARNYGREMKRARKAACGPFRTTLGPGSDGYHEDHIHLDVAQRRGAAYCN